MPKGFRGFQRGNQLGKGRVVSKETREKISKANQGRGKRNHLIRYKENESGCWIWQGVFRSKNCRYGVIHLRKGRGGMVLAHRYFYENKHGEIPKGMFACHKCDNPSCVNPDHIFIGTHTDNMRDKAKKNRQPNGERSGVHKLTERQVIEIRKQAKNDWSSRIINPLSVKYNMHKDTIRKIIQKKLWKHLA